MEIHGGIFVKINEDTEKTLKEFFENEDKKNFKHEINRVIFLNELPYAMLSHYKKSDNDTPQWIESEDEDSTIMFSQLSEMLGDIIAFYQVEEYINYQHWQNGNLLRFFEYSDAGWLTVSGNSDPWENQCFFSDEMLYKRLNDLRDFDELTPEREQKIRNTWAEKIIRSDSEEPQVQSDIIIRAIQDYYQLLPLFKESWNKDE